jgi:hypothetical protein
MTNTSLLLASGLLLVAYLLDMLGRRFRLPNVVLLIVTGLVVRHVLDRAGLKLAYIDEIVPILGTLGLILIVLEGALDLEVTPDRTKTIGMSALSAFIGIVACTAAFTLLFTFVVGLPYALALTAAIPFAVISSAVAIPSAAALPDAPREFVIYESSFSDIIGVLLFYAALASKGDVASFAMDLVGGGALSIVVALAASIALYVLINKAEGHVRFLPLLAGLVCLYAIGKELHLSPLIFVLIAGLVIGNPHLLDFVPYLKRLHSDDYDRTVHEFKGLVAELTFATKAFFFLLLGYWTDVDHLLHPRAWAIAAALVGFIFVSRRGLLRMLRIPDARPLTWIAPRGLITVLLFLAAAEGDALKAFPFGALMLTVLATSSLVALAHHDRDERKNALASAVDRRHAAEPPSRAAAGDGPAPSPAPPG